MLGKLTTVCIILLCILVEYLHEIQQGMLAAYVTQEGI